MISLKFVSNGPINIIPLLVKIMALRCPVHTSLSEPMIVSSLGLNELKVTNSSALITLITSDLFSFH